MSDLISRQAAIDATWFEPSYTDPLNVLTEVRDRLKALPSAQPDLSEYSDKLWRNAYERGKADAKPERKTEWIPIKWHDCTDADREKYGFSDDIVAVFDCEMPDDDQAILVTTSHGYVNQDVCYIDDGFSLDSGYDWIDDITAWMPLPKLYEGGNDA